jgi:hypothetical protein
MPCAWVVLRAYAEAIRFVKRPTDLYPRPKDLLRSTISVDSSPISSPLVKLTEPTEEER